jgi:S1-C subfamily serine protease
MFSARIRKSALAVVMASLAMSTPAALAERADRGGVRLLDQQRLSLSACAQPDFQTLQAILPVATATGSQASGIVFDENRVLTAAHAVSGGGQLFVRIGEAYRSADLLLIDKKNDLAVLSVDTQAIRPLHIAVGMDPIEFQPVWAAGYPRAQAMMTSFGVLQDYHEGALHASATIDSGQSGGGLLACTDGAWELLGMLRGFGAYLDGDHYVKIQNHSVSVAAATIQQFLRTAY